MANFGKMKIADLDQKSIEDWLATLPLSNQTRNHVLYTFRIVLREAKLAGIVRVNVLADAEPFGSDKKQRDVFTLAELHALFPDDDEKLVEIWGEPERAVAFLLLASTGIRSGECRALRWLNLLEGRALYVDSALDKLGRPKGTKTGAARVVLLPTKAQRALAEWRGLTKRKSAEDFIFHEEGRPHGDAWLRRTLRRDGARQGDGRRSVPGGSLVPSYLRLGHAVRRAGRAGPSDERARHRQGAGHLHPPHGAGPSRAAGAGQGSGRNAVDGAAER